MPRQKRTTGTGTGIDERQRSEIIKWLRVAEDAFGEVARVFDDMLKGEALTGDDLIRFRDISRDFESQARQMRAAITIPPPERLM
jgi:hypothetical protein